MFYLLQSHRKGEVTANKASTLFKLFTNFIIIIITIIIDILFSFIIDIIIIIILLFNIVGSTGISLVFRVYTVTDENPSKEDFPVMALKTRHKFFYNSTKS